MKRSMKVYAIALVAFLSVVALAFAPAVQNTVMGGSYFNTDLGFPVVGGKMDTFRNGGSDTIVTSVKGTAKLHSIAYTLDFWKANTVGSVNVTVACYASANNATTYASSPITTFTVNPTLTYSLSPTANNNATTQIYIPNSNFGGTPYDHYKWIATATGGTSTMSWQISANPANR